MSCSPTWAARHPKPPSFGTRRRSFFPAVCPGLPGISDYGVCGIYSVLVQNIGVGSNVSAAIWACMGYTVLLCFALFKTAACQSPYSGPIKEVSRYPE